MLDQLCSNMSYCAVSRNGYHGNLLFWSMCGSVDWLMTMSSAVFYVPQPSLSPLKPRFSVCSDFVRGENVEQQLSKIRLPCIWWLHLYGWDHTLLYSSFHASYMAISLEFSRERSHRYQYKQNIDTHAQANNQTLWSIIFWVLNNV